MEKTFQEIKNPASPFGWRGGERFRKAFKPYWHYYYTQKNVKSQQVWAKNVEDSETDIADRAVYHHHSGGAVCGEYVQTGILT